MIAKEFHVTSTFNSLTTCRPREDYGLARDVRSLIGPSARLTSKKWLCRNDELVTS
jgi:hypothetical protein